MNELGRKRLALEHSGLLNAGDVDGLMELYGDRATLENPVGHTPLTGPDAVRAHWKAAVAARIREVAGEPVAGQDGAHVLLPVTAEMDYLPAGPAFAAHGWLTAPAQPASTRLRRTSMLVIRIDKAGLIQELRAFWGKSDLEVIG